MGSSKPYSVEWVFGEPNEVGSRYRSVGWVPGDRNHVNEGEITEVIPNQRFALRADDKEGTFATMGKPDLRKRMAKLKTTVEASK